MSTLDVSGRPDTGKIVGAGRTPRLASFFAYYFPPSLETGARRPFRFVKYLDRHGYQSQVITNSPQPKDEPRRNVTCVLEAHISRGAGLASRAAEAVQRILPYNERLAWAPQAIDAAEKAIAVRRPDVLVSTSPPLACHLAAMVVSWKHGIPWVADFRDPLYGNPSRDRKGGWLWDAAVERLIVARARAVIANTDAAAQMLVERYPNHASKIHLIWNGYDPEQGITPLPIPRRGYKLMVHSGSVYGQRQPTSFLDSLRRLVSTGVVDPNRFRVRWTGVLELSSAADAAFRELSSEGCVEKSGVVSAETALKEIAEADCLLLLDLNNRGLGLQVPAKVFEYVQTGRPILAFTSRKSPVERILALSGIRHCCIYPDSAPEEIDRQLLEFLQWTSEPSTPSSYFVEQFDGAAQAATLAHILDSVCEPGRKLSQPF
jgi:glycosyltransferase involved in cell wall biosynthesis